MSVATEIEDPFREFAPPSLLSQTLAASFGSQAAALGPGGAESIRSIFESMGIKGSTTQLVGQAQTIVNSSTNLENLYNEDGDGPVAPSDKNCAQERRPALGRKRAKFSLKPVPSQSLPTIDMSSSINHIEDPEEYFLAVEQLENADKELKKLRGETSTNLLQHPNTIARKRRPGLLGKTVSYKHQFSTNDVATEVLVEAQESETSDGIELKLSNVSPSITTDRCSTLQTKITDSKCQDATEREGLAVDEDKKANILLENLLSSFKELDEDEGETLLRESLQVKSIDVGKICLPDLGTIQRLDCNALNSRVTRGQLKASQFSQTSPTLGKSPFVGMAALQKRASLIDPLRHLYTVPPSDDNSCSEDSSMSGGLGRKSLSPLAIDSHDKSGLIGSGAFSLATENGVQLSFVDKMHSPVVEADGITNGKIISDKQPPEDSPHSLNRNTGHCSDGIDIDKDIVSSDLDVCSQEQGTDVHVDPSVVDHQDAGVGGLNSGSTSYTRTEVLAKSPHRDMGENCSNSDINNDTVLGFDDTSHTEAYTNVEDHTLSLRVVKDSSIPSQEILVLNQDQDGLPNLPTRNDEMASEASPNRRNEKANRRWNRKAVAHRDKKTSISRRQSLAGAGTIWDPESGRRRSTRTKCKPLEYWRGERFLYARIHDSLTTVIGVKRASPGKQGLQVKSFVSDQYADIVAQAALH